ncbi:TPA: hypothetical protein H1005_01165, partial [archaeon]|nr:hypothetical protein [Candidatus Naiadarchaeales archaeon SRR2090153.bin1042]
MKKIIPLIAIILLAGIAQGVSAASVDWDRTMLDLGNVVPGGTIFGSATVVSTGINNNVRIVEQDVSLDPLYPNSPYYRLYGLINITSPPGRGEIYDIVELGTLGDGQRVNVEFKCEPRQNLPPGDYWATFSVNSTEDVPGSILNVTCIVLPSSPDIQPPTVSSVTPTTAIQGQPQTYRVTATDNVGVVSCNFFWDSVDKGAMTLVSGNAQNGVWAKTYTENVAGTHVAKA